MKNQKNIKICNQKNIMTNRKFKKGETYHVTSSDGTFGLFRPTYTQTENDDHIIKCNTFTNMNKHWSKDNEAFIRKSDGVCTYPWGIGNSISVHNRPTRIATEQEKLILDNVIEKGEALTPGEIRNIKINIVLE